MSEKYNNETNIQGRLLPGVVWQLTPLAGSRGQKIEPLMILAVGGRTSTHNFSSPEDMEVCCKFLRVHVQLLYDELNHLSN